MEDGRPFSEGALSITDRLLRVALPDNNGLVFPPALQALGPELSKILIAGLHATIRKSADHVQKNFSSIISELLSKTLLGQSVGKGSFLKTFFSSLRTAVKETPKKNHAEKEALKKTIEDLTVAILPGLSRFRRIIGFLASRFFGIGQLRIGTIVNAALESLPEPEIMLTEIFPEPTATMPSPKDAAVQADTPVELIRKKLNIMKESVRAQLNKIDALKHPRQAISVALKLFGVSILALIAPKIMSKAMGASAHENTITLIEKLIKGVLGPASTAPLSQHL